MGRDSPAPQLSKRFGRNRLENGAQERTRTSTALRPLAPEASASTNSTTWARRGSQLWISAERRGAIKQGFGACQQA